jgi:hypothetical protein
MSFENFITNFKNIVVKDLSNNNYLDGSFNINNLITYLSTDPYLQFYEDKLESCIDVIYNRVENSGKQYANLSLLKKSLDNSNNITRYENYETEQDNDDTYYDNYQKYKGSGKYVYNDNLKSKIETKRNNNSLNFCTNMLGNHVGYFGLSLQNSNSSTNFYYMNLKPIHKLTMIDGTKSTMTHNPKAQYTYTVNTTKITILLEILTINQCPYFYSYNLKNGTYLCPIFQVVNGLIACSELLPENSNFQFLYSSSTNLTNSNNIASNRTPTWSWVRIYETEENQGDTDFGNTTSDKSAYLYYVYTNDSDGPQTSFLYPESVPDYCPDGMFLPWTIILCDENNTTITFNASQGVSNFYESLIKTAHEMGGVTLEKQVIKKFGYNASNI